VLNLEIHNRIIKQVHAKRFTGLGLKFRKVDIGKSCPQGRRSSLARGNGTASRRQKRPLTCRRHTPWTHQQTPANGDQESDGSHQFVSPKATKALIILEGCNFGPHQWR
jgi:hypothetical protein